MKRKAGCESCGRQTSARLQKDWVEAFSNVARSRDIKLDIKIEDADLRLAVDEGED